MRALDSGMTQEQVAEEFDIARTTIVYWLRRRRATGRVEPLPPGGGNRSKIRLEVLEEVLEELPDGTRSELTVLYNRKVSRGERVSESSLYRALRRHGYVSKKNS